MELKSDIPIGVQFSLKAEEYSTYPISDIPFSVRVMNRLMGNKISTLEMLLNTTPEMLMSFSGFGKNCMDEIVSNIEELSKGQNTKAYTTPFVHPSASAKIKEYAEDIAIGDFSNIETAELNDREQDLLNCYKEAFSVLGAEIALDCYASPEKIVPIMDMFNAFILENEKRNKLLSVADRMPDYRRKNKAAAYINTYTNDELQKKILFDLCADENATIDSLFMSYLPNDRNALITLTRFLEWCAFDLPAEISHIFELIYKRDNIKTVVQMRARKKTLEQAGIVLGVTRERVRQIEAKAKRQFAHYQGRVKPLLKIAAEMNGATIVSPADIEEYSSGNATELLFFLRGQDSSSYTYDEQLDVFVIGDDSLQERVRTYMDSLPDIINVNQLDSIVTDGSEEYDIPADLISKSILDSYRLTGDVYHRTRLSLRAVYLAVLEKYYPNGIQAYDPTELSAFRTHVTEDFGDVGMPENDRALTARISGICVLCGRGMYRVKKDKYITKELEKRIARFIEQNEYPIILMNTLYSVFEQELSEAGIGNKYYLQGVLRELFSDTYYFRRDYLSKDPESTSLYASIVSFIKKSQYPVQKQQIQHAFPGITDIVLNLAVSDSEILNYFGSYLHVSWLQISEVEKTALKSTLKEFISDHEAHHSTEVFDRLQRDFAELFTRNAALFQFSAFSILEYLFQDEFQFSRPYIAEKGVDIGRPAERLHELIYSGDEFSLADLSEFCKEYHFQLQSQLEYINSCNDQFFLKDAYTMVSIESAGLSEEIGRAVDAIVAAEVDQTQPIAELTCWNRLPRINIPWTDWLLYSVLNKWGRQLTVATSSNQFRLAIPLVSPLGLMDTSAFKDASFTAGGQSIKVDDLDNIDDLIADLIDFDEDPV